MAQGSGFHGHIGRAGLQWDLWLRDGEACPKMRGYEYGGRHGTGITEWRLKMWYVIQTFSGQEERTADMIRKMISQDCIKECFVPKRERLKKFHGSWNKVEEVLFQGYVFLISERPKESYEKLKQVPKLTKVLGRETDYFLALGEQEKRLVEGIGDQEHKTTLSQIVAGQEKKIQVVDGPLKGYVGNIVKTDLHKREVMIAVEFMGRKMELKMGIEMVEMGEK